MYINTLRLTKIIIYSSKTLSICNSLIIYASKKLSICNHVVNKSAQGKEAYYEINMLICNLMANPNKSVHPIALQKYILYIRVDWLLGKVPFGKITPIVILGKAS